MSSIIAPAVCGVCGIVIINAGLFYIRWAFARSKDNPVSLSSDGEQDALNKIEKRLAVRVFFSAEDEFLGGGCD